MPKTRSNQLNDRSITFNSKPELLDFVKERVDADPTIALYGEFAELIGDVVQSYREANPSAAASAMGYVCEVLDEFRDRIATIKELIANGSFPKEDEAIAELKRELRLIE